MYLCMYVRMKKYIWKDWQYVTYNITTVCRAHLVSDVKNTAVQTAIKINQDANIFVSEFSRQVSFPLREGRQAYVLCIEGSATLTCQPLPDSDSTCSDSIVSKGQKQVRYLLYLYIRICMYVCMYVCMYTYTVCITNVCIVFECICYFIKLPIMHVTIHTYLHINIHTYKYILCN